MEFGRCPYCNAMLQYDPGLNEYVKCSSCGDIVHITSFELGQQRTKKQLEEGEAAKQALAAAQQERREMQKRLNDAVSDLSGIRFSQDVLTDLFAAAARDRKTDLEKLEMLQGTAADILKAGDSIVDLVQICARNAQGDREEQNALIEKLLQWSKTSHQEDTERLQEISNESSALLNRANSLDTKISQLQKTADETKEAVRDFQQKWENRNTDEMAALYRHAENLRKERKYDEAEKTYRQLVIKGAGEAEVCWRIVLCHYCVEYQKDDRGSLIPTILYPDLSDPAEVTARQELLESIRTQEEAAYYRPRLEAIDHILDKYRKIRNRVQYDVFISVKQSTGVSYTSDSDIASDLYDHLKGLGLRVFNSRRSAGDIPPGSEWEPYIISALMSSRVLIVVGANAENMNSQWVRNEWSRFQWLQKYDKDTKRTLFCYLHRDMNP